jgi:hypothetical protein
MSGSKALPGPVEMRKPSLEWTMRQTGGYTGTNLKVYLGDLFKLDDEQFLRHTPANIWEFGNRVDWVTSYFTEFGIHTGWDGAEHTDENTPYFLTTYGYALGAGKVREWPAKRGNKRTGGARKAKPDIRQLSEEQRAHAPWLRKDERRAPHPT